MIEKNVESAILTILQEIGEDTEREGIDCTPERVARLYKKCFYSYRNKLQIMNETTRNSEFGKNIIPITVFDNDDEYNELLIRKVKFWSFCEHHIVPFFGEAHVGIIPDKKILGMNKIDKVVQYYAARLQIQERMTKQITEWINDNVKPLGVVVTIKARHMCAELQGDEGDFVTSAVKGVFLKEPKGKSPKNEFFKLIKL